MMRSTLARAARAIALAFGRATLTKADDSTKLQTLSVEGMYGEKHDGIEHWHPFGFTSVPKAPDGAEAEVLLAFLGANQSHPVALGVADRRSRPKNLKEGESAHHDDQGQYSKLARDGHVAVAKEHSITAGDKPETGPHEMNEQHKGLAARLAQAENHISGLHYALSRVRETAQGRVPELAAMATILDKTPAGLDAMAADVQALAQSYLQKQVQQGLAKFLNPNLAALASVLSGGIEAAITSAQGQLASLLANNPVVATVDAVQAELAALTSSNAAADVLQAGIARLQPQIDALIAANPIVSTVADLRNQLTALIAQAGPGLNFLAGQQRLVQGLTKSMKLSP